MGNRGGDSAGGRAASVECKGATSAFLVAWMCFEEVEDGTWTHDRDALVTAYLLQLLVARD